MYRFEKLFRVAKFVFPAVLLISCGADHAEDFPPTFQAVVRPRFEPNSYDARLTWKVDTHPRKWVLYRSSPQEPRKQIAELPVDKLEFLDEDVTPEKKYHYELESMDSKSTPVASVDLQVPWDLEIRGIFVPKPGVELNPNRIFFHPNSVLRTNGNDLIIRTGEIISQDGVIETFFSGDRASESSTGKSGGLIDIKAAKGKGSITVYGRGMDGGQGAPGASEKPEVTREMESSLRKTIKDSVRTIELVLDDPVQRKPPEPLVDAIRILPLGGQPSRQEPEMIQTRTRDPQLDGKDGGHGGDGGRGGDSARILIEVTDSSRFEVKAYPVPGMGGRGGYGGEGAPGKRFESTQESRTNGHHSIHTISRQGEKGRDGMPGKAGLPGATLPMSLRLGDKVTNESSK